LITKYNILYHLPKKYKNIPKIGWKIFLFFR